ncbi:S1 family serine peptidase [Amycolatopsis jejuensis]|uniref:S1 family serine peptidase n=1 Tax=Amycolatopsis jejuensis TaxID=330084 RepID=UPI00068B4B85|nr:serine protease [Amycolatopsis jejuensis]
MRIPFSRRRAAVLLAAAALVATAVPAHAAPPPGDGAQGQIVGGTEVSDDAYPFMASLRNKGSGNGYERHVCGGSLINSDTVLTAAHCVPGADVKDLEVVVGRTVLSNDQQGQVRNVTDAQTHPKYGEKLGYDIAVLKLDEPVTGIVPIQQPTRGTDGLIRPGETATVIGWGNTDPVQINNPDRLRQVDVPILSHQECEISYPGSEDVTYNRATDFCAGVAGKDSCQGDSGGPIFRVVPGTRTYIQIGIVSQGQGCAERGGPGVYTYTGSPEAMSIVPV